MLTRSGLHHALAVATGDVEPGRTPEALRSSVARAGDAPPDLSPVRGRTMLAWDDEAVLWDALDVVTGERTLALVGPRSRLAAVVKDSPLPAVLVEGPTPYARYAPFGCLLADLLPVEPDPIFAAEIAAAVLRTAHLSPATLAPEVLALRDGRWALAWTGDTGPGDARALLDTLDPEGTLASAHRDHAAYSASLATILTGERHAVVARLRRLGRRDHRARLAPLARRLALTLAPPIAAGDADGLRVVSDGVTVTLGAGALAWSAETGLDPRVSRAILRRATTAADPTLAPLLRWLSAASRLRVDRALLALASTA